MSYIAIAAGGLVAVAAYSYLSTPSDVKKPDSQFREQTPSNPAGYPPSLTSPSTVGGPTAPTPVAPSIPPAITPLAPAPVVPVASSIPKPTAVVPSVSATPVPVPTTVCRLYAGTGDTYYYGKNPDATAAQCESYNAELIASNSVARYKMVPADTPVAQCVIS